MNLYGIYLTVGGTTIRFPVNPQAVTIDYPASNERFNVLSLGEIIQPRKPGLKVVSWSDGLLPGRSSTPYVLTSGDFKEPEFYIRFLNTCKVSGTVCTFTIDRRYEDGTAFHSDTWPVIVENFKVTEKGGETGDFYYDITLTEYRDYAPGSVSLTRTSSNTVEAIAQKTRNAPSNQLVVGKMVTVNRVYCYDSYGAKPHGNGNGRTAVVGRILAETRAYPILLKTSSGAALGWCKKSAVTV